MNWPKVLDTAAGTMLYSCSLCHLTAQCIIVGFLSLYNFEMMSLHIIFLSILLYILGHCYTAPKLYVSAIKVLLNKECFGHITQFFNSSVCVRVSVMLPSAFYRQLNIHCGQVLTWTYA